jgi:hypothetical protein
MKSEIACPGVEQRAALAAAVDAGERAARLEGCARRGRGRGGLNGAQGRASGMRLSVELTTPPIACEP